MHVPKTLILLAIGSTGVFATPTPAPAEVPAGKAAEKLAPPVQTQKATVASGHNGNYTVINSDCPCDRHARQFCTLFRRERVRDYTCHRISRPSVSMRVFDETIAEDNRLLCTAFEGGACDGKAAPEYSFLDNTRCGEPTKEGTKNKKWEYKSFMCHHPGW